MGALRTAICSAGAAAALLLGGAMWALAAPGEERSKEIIKNLPEANPLRLEETRRRNVLILQALKEAAETDLNVARGGK